MAPSLGHASGSLPRIQQEVCPQHDQPVAVLAKRAPLRRQSTSSCMLVLVPVQAMSRHEVVRASRCEHRRKHRGKHRVQFAGGNAHLAAGLVVSSSRGRSVYSRMRSTLFMLSSTSVVWRIIQVSRSVRSRVAVSSSPARPAVRFGLVLGFRLEG